MRVLILGIGDAFTRLSYGSSALIEAPGGYVLLDCPDLVHRALFEATFGVGWEVDASEVDHVLLTHLHGDHCNGLESLGFARMVLRLEQPGLRRPRLYASPPASRRIWDRLAPAMDHLGHLDRPARLDDFFEAQTLGVGFETEIAGLSVRCRYSAHSIPTLGFLISDGNWTLGWSGDTTFDREHVEWLAQADLVVHESSAGPVHTPIESLNGLPDELRRKIRLIHLPDDFDPDRTDIPMLAVGDVLDRRCAPRPTGLRTEEVCPITT